MSKEGTEGNRGETVQLISGGLILSTGLAVAALYAAEQSFEGVFIGFAFIVFGYELSQYSVYTSEDSKARAFVQDIVESSRLTDFLMVLVGAGAITYGFTLLFESVAETKITLALLSAAMMFGGYMVAHYGLNKTVI